MAGIVRDRNGDLIKIGDQVRIVGEPELGKLPKGDVLRSRDVFRHILGTYRRVEAFDARGFVELEVRIRQGPLKGLHFVWLEPEFVRLRAELKHRS